MAAPGMEVAPSGPIAPAIDGAVTSYFEWIGSGLYRVDERSGSMHGKKFLVKEAHFGSDGSNFYLRLDFHPGREQETSVMEARLTAQPLPDGPTSHLNLSFSHGSVNATGVKFAVDPPSEAAQSVECALGRVMELRISLQALGIAAGGGLRFQFSLWQGGLPMDAVPQQGWIQMRTTDPIEMAG
jgi:hypothetical protein